MNDDHSLQVILAPMEGVLDGVTREILTTINHYDYCVTEFVRVVDTLLPKKTFYRLCPELLNGGKTRSGTPVRVQLLGSNPDSMAENAVRAIALGSYGIDINCGCPSKTVIGSDGGANLLRSPYRIYQLITSIRQAIPSPIVLSVKIRLGWESADELSDIAAAIQQAGADEITVHGRTKKEGYRADKINWHAIAAIRQQLTIPVIANGEIKNASSAYRCQQITGCHALMVARGALSLPNLGAMIKQRHNKLSWFEVMKLLYFYIDMNHQTKPHYCASRLKQWLTYLRLEYTEAIGLFASIKLIQHREQLIQVIKQHIIDCDK